ncbi:MAG: tail fiber domain-containing protein, partial [Vicinamibacterales bacterium]
GNGGSVRPDPPTTNIPPLISLRADGGFLAGGQITVGTIPASGPGPRLMWHPAKAAIRAGSVTAAAWDDGNVGQVSAAFNLNTRAIGLASFAANANSVASGNYSFAIGFNTTASGAESTATGSSTTASGDRSFSGGVMTTASGAMAVALGQGTNAIGPHSVAMGLNSSATAAHALAMGNGTIASGIDSLAAGANSQANGFASVALGLRALAGGDGSVVLGSDAVAQAAAPGSFIFGDRSTTTDITAFIPNQFLVRAAGGVGFYTNAAMSIGVELAPNGSQWLVVSDVNAKQSFRDLDGEDVLAKLAEMPIQTWSYRAQGDHVRHVGPTAQDFAAAFGLGEDPLRIGTVDADGIALRAIQALEVRTRQLAELVERLAAVERELALVKTGGRQ